MVNTMINAMCQIEPCYNAWATPIEPQEGNAAGQVYWIVNRLKEDNKKLNILFNNDVLVNHNYYGDEPSFAILRESPSILEWYHTNLYKAQGSFFDAMCRLMKSKTNKFKTLYTFDKRYEGLPNTVIVPACSGTLIADKNNRSLYEGEKNNLITFVTSNKQMTEEQRIRVRLANHLNNSGIKVYGKGFDEVICKSEVMRNSMFCFAIENGIYKGYHSEKLIDCFLTGCVPIYMGDPDISEFFDTDGMIICETEKKLYQKLTEITPELYQKMLPHVRKNFEIATKYYALGTLEPHITMMYRELIDENN